MQLMESRLMDSMKTTMGKTMKEAMKPIQQSIDKLLVAKSTMEAEEGKIVKLQNDNAIRQSKASFALGDDDNDKVEFFLSSWMGFIVTNGTVRTRQCWQNASWMMSSWMGAVPIHDDDAMMM